LSDYDAVDARVKAYDRESFSRWRDEEREDRNLQRYMARIFSGWDDLLLQSLSPPWTDNDEARIEAWLRKG
jgi:hypothetical protein